MTDKIQEIREAMQNAIPGLSAVIKVEDLSYLLTELDELKGERKLVLEHIQNGGMRANGEPAVVFYEILVNLFRQNGGKNFLTLTVEKPDKSERYAITIQNLNGELSPAEKIGTLQQQLKQAIEALEWYAKNGGDDRDYAQEVISIIREEAGNGLPKAIDPTASPSRQAAAEGGIP